MKKYGLVWALFAPAIYGSLALPPNQFGNQTGGVTLDVAGYSGPDYFCNYNAYTGACSASITTNQPSTMTGSAGGNAWSYNNANGAHLFAASYGTGYANATATSASYIFDTVANNSAAQLEFQLQFHVSAELYGLLGGSANLQVMLQDSQNPANPTYWNYQGGGGTAAGNDFFVNRDVTTPMMTVPAHSTDRWSLTIQAKAVISNFPNQNLPASNAFADMANTLGLTGFSVFDQSGNPVDPTSLVSLNGFDYVTQTAAAPEPGSWLLMLAGAAALALRRRNRQTRVESHHR